MSEQVKVPSAPDLVGRTLGHFLITSRLGEGGMGVVYRATDQRLRRTVALKVLANDTVSDETHRRRFFREARSAAAVTHPNVATIYEIQEVDGLCYIAMELVEGVTLRDIMFKGKPALSETLRLLRGVARALAKAHDSGIVHRDLKPENVMVNEDHEVKVLDFGLAKLLVDDTPGLDETASQETASRIVGTPSYMSPEQAMGRPVDARTDVWAFGVIMYELLVGQRPFRGQNSMETLVSIARDDLPPVTSLVPLPASIEHVVETCLKKNADERYANGSELFAAIETVETSRRLQVDIGSLPTEELGSLARVDDAMKERLPSRTRRTEVRGGSRTPRLVAAGVVGLLAIAVTIAVAQRMRSGATTGAPAASASALASAAGGSPADKLLAEGDQREREGLHDLACAAYQRASDADPSSARAGFETVACLTGSPQRARPFFQRAWAGRASLSPRDAALLDAYEAIVQRNPRDQEEAVKRLRAAAQRFPDDARVHSVLGRASADLDIPTSLQEIDRSLALDPEQPRALALQSDLRAYTGDFTGARESGEKCLAISRNALACLREIAWLDGEFGDCKALEGDGRRMLAVDPDDAKGTRFVANALAAQGSTLTAIQEFLRRRRERLPATDRASSQHDDEEALAMLGGDFVRAAKLARDSYDAVRDSTVLTEHGRAARVLVAIDLEAGRLDEASTVAREYLAKRDGWDPSARLDDWALTDDPTPRMLWTLVQTGAMDPGAFARERAKTVERWSAGVVAILRAFVWIDGYASAVESPADAAVALEALPPYLPLPSYTPLSLASFDVGRTYLLGGKVDDALPLLEKATTNCFVFDHPIEHTRAYYFLGQAREAKGDQDGACTAYAAVQERWGHATPRSVTADKALSRMRALHCKP
jgi:serine/threonine-protein kinase